MSKKCKIVLTAVMFSLLLFSGFFLEQAQAQGAQFSNPIPWNDLEAVVNSFLKALQGVIALLAVVFIVIGGIMYMTSGGDEKMTENAKKTITGAMIGLAVAVGAPSLLSEIQRILGQTPGGGKTLYEIISGVLNLLLSFVGLLAIIGMVTGGIFYMTSAGDEERIEKGKNIITYSIIGIAVALLGLVIVKAVAVVIAGP